MSKRVGHCWGSRKDEGEKDKAFLHSLLLIWNLTFKKFNTGCSFQSKNKDDSFTESNLLWNKMDTFAGN